MKTENLFEALDLINEAQKKVLNARLTIEKDTESTAHQFDNTNRAYEQLNAARIFIKEAFSL